MTEREALKLALEAFDDRSSLMKWQEARDAVKEALAQPEPPPECQTEAEKAAFAFGWFKAMEAQRKPEQKRPQNCGTGYCSCIECVMEPEPVAWPCVIAEADFSENTITLTMQCTDYKVSAGKHWLSNTPPQRTWVGLTKAQCGVLWKTNMTPFEYYQAIEDKLKEKNT